MYYNINYTVRTIPGAFPLRVPAFAFPPYLVLDLVFSVPSHKFAKLISCGSDTLSEPYSVVGILNLIQASIQDAWRFSILLLEDIRDCNTDTYHWHACETLFSGTCSTRRLTTIGMVCRWIHQEQSVDTQPHPRPLHCLDLGLCLGSRDTHSTQLNSKICSLCRIY